MNILTSAEVDDVARVGLEAIRTALQPQSTPAEMLRADQALKVLGEGGKRKGRELKQIEVTLKVTKFIGLPAEDQRPLWTQLLGTRAAADTKSPETLAPVLSTVSSENGPGN